MIIWLLKFNFKLILNLMRILPPITNKLGLVKYGSIWTEKRNLGHLSSSS